MNQRLIQYVYLVVALFVANVAFTQALPLRLQEQIESFLEDQESSDVNIDDLITLYTSLQNNPIDVNKVTYEDLLDLQIIDEIKIQAFLDYREKYGPFLVLEELQTIPTWTLQEAKFMSLLSDVKGEGNYRLSLPKMATQGKNELYLKMRRVLEDQVGYSLRDDSTKYYLGDQNTLVARYRYNYENRMKYGFILEKDAGEEFFAGSNKKYGFDFATFHFYLKDYTEFLKDIAIGDYTVSMGQGLIAHNDFGAGKSSWVNDIKLGGRTIKPYNSVSENLYNRGAAVRLHPIDNVDITLFGSLANKDANIIIETDSLETEDQFFSSFQNSGYHRTESEIAKERTLEETKYGGIIKYSSSNWHIAANVQHQEYNAFLDRDDQPYNKFRFRGDKLTNASVDYGYRYKNINLFGEVAKSNPGGVAQLHGMLLGLDRHVSMSVLYRNYQRDYYALQPNAFGELSSISNESGIYVGLEVKPTYRWKFRMYADLWQHPWLKFQTDSPTTGREYLARIDYTIKRKLNIYLQYFYESKLSNYSGYEGKIDAPVRQNRQKLRLHVNNKISKALELRSRLEVTRFEQGETSHGIAIMQDVLYKPIGLPVSFTSRIALFDTDDYDSRVYAYENDILYEFYIPAYFYQGFRYYINARWNVTRFLTAELRYANTRYTNRNEIGSGGDRINGNVKSEIKAQVRLRF